MSTYNTDDDSVEGKEGNKKVSVDLAMDSISQVIYREQQTSNEPSEYPRTLYNLAEKNDTKGTRDAR